MLLVGAGMLVRTYLNAQSAQSGFQTTGLLAATIDADQINLDQPAGVRVFHDVVERLSAIPGITDVALTRDLPLGRGRTVTVTADAGTASRGAESVDGVPMLVSPHFFQTVVVAIRQGRAFSDTEPARPQVAVINEALARRLWPEISPLGRTFRVSGRSDESIEVIGVLSETNDSSLSQGAQPLFYRPFPQEYSARMMVLMRVHGDSRPVFSEARRTIQAVNPDLSIVDLRTVDQLLDDADAQRRIPAVLLSLVGSLAVLLSAVGLYGVVAYGVRQRAHELGIRLALGARPADVRRLVLRQGFAIVAIGLAVGIVGAIGVAQVAHRVLFGVGRLDAPTIAGVCTILTATAFTALYLPARWASRVEPAQTLRGE